MKKYPQADVKHTECIFWMEVPQEAQLDKVNGRCMEWTAIFQKH